MSESQPAPESQQPVAPEPSAPAVGSADTGVPEGYVPLAELEAERARAREFQGRYDRLAAERQSAEPAPKSPKGDAGPGFDPDSYRASLLRDVYAASFMQRSADEIRAAFPYADSALFEPDRLAGYSDPESLRFAASESHRRVASILESEKARLAEEARAELAAHQGGGSGPAGVNLTPGGDPTPEQLVAMSTEEWDALEAANPGVIERVLAQAGQ